MQEKKQKIKRMKKGSQYDFGVPLSILCLLATRAAAYRQARGWWGDLHGGELRGG
jgi:hypothetical protein